MAMARKRGPGRDNGPVLARPPRRSVDLVAIVAALVLVSCGSPGETGPASPSGALGAVHDVVREGNTALAAGEDTTAQGALASVRGMLDVLGLDPLSPQWSSGGSSEGLRPVVDSLVALALEQRAAARTRKDWAAADAVRDRLKQAGVVTEDTAHGPRWTIEGR